MARSSRSTARPTSLPSGNAVVAGVRISHPDRVIYPALKTTKLDLARYYESMAPTILPHLRGRPLTLVHCPQGLLGDCRYLRHAKAWGPSALRRVKIEEKTKVGEYLIADTAAAVVSLAQMGIVEIHTWNATDDDIERPNRLIWDLDPGPAVEWPTIVSAARTVREVLQTLRLESWIKTTGGRGLHVVAPIVPERQWEDCLGFSRRIAQALAGAQPSLYTTDFRKPGRETKILIDYLRNNRTNTSICAFSTRARPGGTVSMPIAWDALKRALRPERFTVDTVPRHIARRNADPWAGYWRAKQRLTGAAIDAARRL